MPLNPARQWFDPMAMGNEVDRNDSPQDALFSLAKSYPSMFVMLDSSNPHPLGEHLERIPPANAYRLAHPDFRDDSRYAPLLVQTSDAHDPLLDASIALATSQTKEPMSRLRQAGVWVCSRLEPRSLFSRLSALLRLRHPGGASRLRLHDPRVLAQLDRLLSKEQLAAFAALGAWRYLDQDAVLREFAGGPFDVPPATRLRADTKQWEALRRVGMVNDAVGVLRRMGMAYRPEWLIDAHVLLERAQRQGYANQQDLVAFAVHGLWVHPEFDRHPSVRKALSGKVGRDGGFCMAMASFDEEQLSTIRQDLCRTHPA